MPTNNLLIGLIAAVLCLIGFLLSIHPLFIKATPIGVIRKMLSAFTIGAGIMLTVISGLVAFAYLGSSGIKKNWDLETLFELFCLLSPIGLLAMAGSFIRLSTQDITKSYFSSRLTNIAQKSKNIKKNEQQGNPPEK